MDEVEELETRMHKKI